MVWVDAALGLSWENLGHRTSSPDPAPLPSPLSSIPLVSPLFAILFCSSNSASVSSGLEGSGANSSMVRTTKSTEEKKELVERRNKRTVAHA